MIAVDSDETELLRIVTSLSGYGDPIKRVGERWGRSLGLCCTAGQCNGTNMLLHGIGPEGVLRAQVINEQDKVLKCRIYD
jgi:hypothetical protein